MTWVTWRQHRIEGLWAAILAALLAGSTAYVAYQLWLAAPNCQEAIGHSYCLSGDVWGQIALRIVQFNLFQYGLVVLPALAGAFIGAPLVAREIENGTQRLAWTQGVTRMRWLSVKIVLVFLPLLAMAAVAGLAEVVLLNVQGPDANRWDVFDQQAPLIVASTLFALALGVALGAVIGRSIPAMAATLVTFVAVRVGIAELARPHFMAPVRVVTHELNTVGTQANPTAWLLGDAQAYNSAGQLLTQGVPVVNGQPSYLVQYLQPGSRFWAFQTIESVILTGLAVLVLAVAVYWVTRRAS